MSYFKKTDKFNKISSDEDEIFSIFLNINHSSDEMDIHDDIIKSIKQYYSTNNFKEEFVEILNNISLRIFGEPNIPNNLPRTVNEAVQEKPKTVNKYSKKYKL